MRTHEEGWNARTLVTEFKAVMITLRSALALGYDSSTLSDALDPEDQMENAAFQNAPMDNRTVETGSKREYSHLREDVLMVLHLARKARPSGTRGLWSILVHVLDGTYVRTLIACHSPGAMYVRNCGSLTRLVR